MQWLDVIFWLLLMILVIYEALNVMKRIKDPATKNSAIVEIILIIVAAAVLIEGLVVFRDTEYADDAPIPVVRRITNIVRKPFKKKVVKPAPAKEAVETAPAAEPAKKAAKKK